MKSWLGLLLGIAIGVSLDVLAVTSYNYFAPGGALSCSGACTAQSVDLTQSGFVSGPLRAGAGGTGANTLTLHGVLVGQGTAAVGAVTAMAADTLLQGQGTGADPAAVSIGNCGDATHALSYSAHAFGCQAITGGGGSTLKIANGQVNAACTTIINAQNVNSLVAVSTGVCEVVYTSSFFAAEPNCTFTPIGVSPQITPAVISTTNVNQVTVQMKNLSGTSVNTGFTFNCFGT